MKKDQRKLIKLDYHRNGISGEGFHVILFTWQDERKDPRRMQAVVFETSGQCAVFDIDELGKENIEFAHGNSWRGDHFEDDCRRWITEEGARKDAEFEAKYAALKAERAQ